MILHGCRLNYFLPMHLGRGSGWHPHISFTGRHSRKKREPIVQQCNSTRFGLRRAVTPLTLRRQSLTPVGITWSNLPSDLKSNSQMHLDIHGISNSHTDMVSSHYCVDLPLNSFL